MLYGRRHTRSRAEEIKIEILQFSGLHDDALVEVEAQMSGLEPDFIYGMMDLFYVSFSSFFVERSTCFDNPHDISPDRLYETPHEERVDQKTNELVSVSDGTNLTHITT